MGEIKQIEYTALVDLLIEYTESLTKMIAAGITAGQTFAETQATLKAIQAEIRNRRPHCIEDQDKNSQITDRSSSNSYPSA